MFEFKCSAGLLFDVNRQICDFKMNVENCDVVAEAVVPRPLLEAGGCKTGELGCADRTCLPSEYFCDGSVDCPDGSDEGWCGKCRLRRQNKESPYSHSEKLIHRRFRNDFVFNVKNNA